MPSSQALPRTQTIYWDRTGTAPIPQTITTAVVETEEVLYLQFSINFENTAIEWLHATNVTGSYVEDDTLQLELQNIDILPSGNYKATIVFEPSNSETYLTPFSCEINLVLSGAAPNQIVTDKTTYNVVFNRATNELTGETAVGILNNTEPIQLKFWQNQIVFAPAENFTTGFTLADNPTTSLATNPILPATGSISIPAKILKQTGEFVQGFTINLVIVDGGITVTPTSLAFEVFKNTTEKSAVLTVTNPLGIDFSVTEFPDWLNLDDTNGNTSQNIIVTTETSALEVGTYSGIIKFSYNDDFLDIPVTLVLKQFIVIDESKDFCLDLPPVLVYLKTENAMFVRVTMTAVYNVLGVVSTFEKVYQMPYFGGIASFELGEKLHRHFPRAKRHFFDETSLEFMENIVASIKVDELNANLEVLFTETASNIKLFPGKKPIAYPLLSNSISRKKNEGSIIFTSVVEGEAVNLTKIAENDLVNPLVLGSTTINFYDLPKVFAPVHLRWENQNLAPEWFTFTGEYKIAPDFSHTYARNIFNAQNEKYDTSKVKTLTVETGFFLAKELLLMTEIIESKLAYAKINGIIYRCFNVTKKNTEVDSTEELISRPLEFIIVEE